MNALVPLLAQVPENKAPLWIGIAVVVVLLVVFAAIIYYVATKSRSFTPTNEDDE